MSIVVNLFLKKAIGRLNRYISISEKDVEVSRPWAFLNAKVYTKCATDLHHSKKLNIFYPFITPIGSSAVTIRVRSD